MKVIICGGRKYKFTGDDIDFLYSIRPLIGEVVSGMSGGVKVTHAPDSRVPGVATSDKERLHVRTDWTVEQIANTSDYDEIYGADLWGVRWAIDNGIKVEPFPISDERWRVLGRAAGPARNRLMVNYADAIIAFPGGRGTINCCRQARDHGLVPMYVKPVDQTEPEISDSVQNYLLAQKIQAEQTLNPDVKLDDVAWYGSRKPVSFDLGGLKVKSNGILG